MNEYKVALESKKDKDIQEKATAEDMRKKATERVGETRITHYNTFTCLHYMYCEILLQDFE